MRWSRSARPQHPSHAGVSGRSSTRSRSSARDPSVRSEGFALRDVRRSPRILAAQPHLVGRHGCVPGVAANAGCADAGLLERRGISLRPAAIRPAHHAFAERPPRPCGWSLPPHRVAGDRFCADGITATRARSRVSSPAQLAITRVNDEAGQPYVYNSMLVRAASADDS